MAWSTIQDELRETLWLAAVIWGLSIVGVGLGVALALSFE
jgi:hypothetical protein